MVHSKTDEDFEQQEVSVAAGPDISDGSYHLCYAWSISDQLLFASGSFAV